MITQVLFAEVADKASCSWSLTRRLGPCIISVKDGAIEITSKGGAANFSGVEIWKSVSGAR
jgi:hypothetical protein